MHFLSSNLNTKEIPPWAPREDWGYRPQLAARRAPSPGDDHRGLFPSCCSHALQQRPSLLLPTTHSKLGFLPWRKGKAPGRAVLGGRAAPPWGAHLSSRVLLALLVGSTPASLSEETSYWKWVCIWVRTAHTNVSVSLGFPREGAACVCSLPCPQRTAANFAGSWPISEPAFFTPLWGPSPHVCLPLLRENQMSPKFLLSSRPRYTDSCQAFLPGLSFPSFPSLSLQTPHDPRNSHRPPHPHLAPSFRLLGKWHQLTRSSNLKMSESLTSPFLPVACWSSKSVDSTQ